MNATLHIREIQPQDAIEVATLSLQLGYERSSEQILSWINAHDQATQVAYVACRAYEVLGWI